MSKGELYIYGMVVRDIRRFIHPRKSILASGNMVFLRSINLHISLTTMPLIIIVYNTKTMQAQIQLKGKHHTSLLILHNVTILWRYLDYSLEFSYTNHNFNRKMLTISERMGYDTWEGDTTHKREKLSFVLQTYDG